MAPDTYRAKRVSLQVWIDADKRRRLKMMSGDVGKSITEIVNLLIDEGLDRYDAQVAFKASRQDTGYSITQKMPAGTKPMGTMTEEEIEAYPLT